MAVALNRRRRSIPPAGGVGIGHVSGAYKSTWAAPYEFVAVAVRSDGGQSGVIHWS